MITARPRLAIRGRLPGELIASAWNWQYAARLWLAGRICGLRRENPPDTREPKRVLLVIAGLLGDSIMSSPVIVEARRLWPRAHITLLGMRHNCDLFAACPLLDELHAAGAIPFSVRGRAQVRQLQAWLTSRSFDVVLTILGDQFGVVLKRAGIPIRVGVLGSPLASCHTHTYDIGSARTWGPNERLKALAVLGHIVEDSAPRAWVTDAARASACATLLARGLNEAQPYVAIHPFGSTPRQWWPLERVEQLAWGLAKRGVRGVLVGGGETSRAVPASVKLATIDLTGALSIQELLALIDGARAVVTTDSGPFHMAGALGRPALGLFRASRPEHASLYSTATVVLETQPDCTQECQWDRCRVTPCRQMGALSAERVLQALDHLMATASA